MDALTFILMIAAIVAIGLVSCKAKPRRWTQSSTGKPVKFTYTEKDCRKFYRKA